MEVTHLTGRWLISALSIFFLIKVCRALDTTNDTFQNVTDSELSEFSTVPFTNLDFTETTQQWLNDTINTTTVISSKDSNVTDLDPSLDQSPKQELGQKFLTFTTPDEDICSCDIHGNLCDINCCCDTDCSEEDMKVFSRCHSQALTPDKNYCYQKDIIFRNNTVYKMEIDPESQLFCIVRDNTKARFWYRDWVVPKTHRELKDIVDYEAKKSYLWDMDQEPEEIIESLDFREGSDIYIHFISPNQKKNVSKWKLPSSCFSQACSCHKDIRYLEDFESSCTEFFSKVSDACTKNPLFSANTFSNFCFDTQTTLSGINTRLSDLVSHTKKANVSDDSHSPDACIKVTFPKPIYSTTQKKCSNVVREVHYTVTHNGIGGIQNVAMRVKLVDVSETVTSIPQQYSVTFKWINASDVVNRSGNPGYQIGFPILAGTNVSLDADGPNTIKVLPQGLSVLSSDTGGFCSTGRKAIEFGRNVKASCRLQKYTSDCTSVQERILNILLGSSKKEVFVGVFGNANDSNIDDWVEAHHEDYDIAQNNDFCYVTSEIQIIVTFASVGTVTNPQNKILGVLYRYGKPESFEPGIILTTSVSFLDVTRPVITTYPKAPSLKVYLPSDFFYPFLRSSSQIYMCNHILVIFLLIFLKCFMI